MSYVGIDGSFTRTGIAVYDKGVLNLTYLAKERATEKDYQTMYHRVESMTDRILALIQSFGDITAVIAEEPLPSASFSSGLFALDTMMFHKISDLDSVEELYNVHPSYLVHIHKKRGYSKSDSVNKAKELIALYEKAGVKVNILTGGRLAHDTAEALIFLTRLLVLKSVRINGQTFTEIFKSIPELSTPKEKLLVRKER